MIDGVIVSERRRKRGILWNKRIDSLSLSHSEREAWAVVRRSNTADFTQIAKSKREIFCRALTGNCRRPRAVEAVGWECPVRHSHGNSPKFVGQWSTRLGGRLSLSLVVNRFVRPCESGCAWPRRLSLLQAPLESLSLPPAGRRLPYIIGLCVAQWQARTAGKHGWQHDFQGAAIPLGRSWCLRDSLRTSFILREKSYKGSPTELPSRLSESLTTDAQITVFP